MKIQSLPTTSKTQKFQSSRYPRASKKSKRIARNKIPIVRMSFRAKNFRRLRRLKKQKTKNKNWVLKIEEKTETTQV